MPELWSIRQICRQLKISRVTFYRMRKEGRIPLPSKQDFTKRPRWNLEDLKKLLNDEK